ncbi:MAG: folate family ECF transporter S component [Enterocloster sp.]
MTRLTALFTCSCAELKRVRTVTVCGMMGAIAIVLGSLSIYVTDSIRIGFSGIPNQLIDCMFGPVVGSLFAGALDILKYLIKPVGTFFPGFTLVAMLAGLIYGSFFYRKPVSFLRVLAAHFVVALVCNVILNTLCLSVLGGKGFLLLLPARAVKNLIMWPIDSIIFYNIAKLLEASGVFRAMGSQKS